jgi:1-acyl-sn-glycerol-3-phosphate acyltransferase
MLSFLKSPWFYIPYTLINFLITLYVYKWGQKFYESKNLKPVNFHLKYPEFKRYDKLNIFKIFFGMMFFFWIRSILILIGIISCYITISITFLRDKSDTSISTNKRKFVKFALNFYTNLCFIILGIIRKEQRKSFPEIYKKYLGSDHNSNTNFDNNYSLIISNHVSWVEILHYLGKFAPGYISKDTIKNFPFIGLIATKLQCLFLDRTNSENRLYVAEQIKKRQDNFMKNERNIVSPLIVFPEGTLTSGRHLLKFKRGIKMI